MMRIFAILSPIFLWACIEAAPQKGAFVPFRTVMSETKSLPYECIDFRSNDGTCEAVAENTLKDNKVLTSSRAKLNLDGVRLEIGMEVQANIIEEKVCANPRDFKIRLISSSNPTIGEVMLGFLKDAVTRMPKYCVAYFRNASGGYYFEARYPDGSLVPESTGVSHFFARPKALRDLTAN